MLKSISSRPLAQLLRSTVARWVTQWKHAREEDGGVRQAGERIDTQTVAEIEVSGVWGLGVWGFRVAAVD